MRRDKRGLSANEHTQTANKGGSSCYWAQECNIPILNCVKEEVSIHTDNQTNVKSFPYHLIKSGQEGKAHSRIRHEWFKI